MAHAAGSFVALSGTAQASQFVLRRQTTDDQTLDLRIDPPPPDDRRRADPRRRGPGLGPLRRRGLGRLPGPGADQAGRQHHRARRRADRGDPGRGRPGLGGVAVEAGDASNSLDIMVTGAAATTIRLVGAVRATQVAF